MTPPPTLEEAIRRFDRAVKWFWRVLWFAIAATALNVGVTVWRLLR